jgi:hypothetical protein
VHSQYKSKHFCIVKTKQCLAPFARKSEVFVRSPDKVVFPPRLYFGLKMRLFFYKKRRYLMKCALYVSDITFIGYGEEKSCSVRKEK